jgi:hypothetical protein
MIFRTSGGDLIEINKYSFKNDRLYYEKILSVKRPVSNSKSVMLDFLSKTSCTQNSSIETTFGYKK